MNQPSVAVSTSSRVGVDAPRFLRELAREQDFAPLRIEGRLPADLRGTLYRNAPARYESGTRPHWFDGRGAVTAVRFDGGTASGSVKLLHTPSMDVDRGRAAPRYGAFRQPMGGLQRVRALFGGQAVRNLANINLLPWQGRLFALYEATLPVEIDPHTLATIGETTLDGLIQQSWNAHPRRVASRHTTYQFGLRIAAQVMLDVFALPGDGPAQRLASVPLPGVMELHDFFATDEHLVFVLAPLWCSSLELLVNGSFVESLRWRPEQPTTLLVMPLADPGKVQRIETEPFFHWHGVNAYARAAGRELVLDLVRYPDFAATKLTLDALSDGVEAPAPRGGTLWRGVVDLDRGSAQWEERWAEGCEFPVVHRDVQGARHTQTWLAARRSGAQGRGAYDSLCRVDVERGTADWITLAAGCTASEPAIVPRSTSENDAWVLALINDHKADASWLGVWDATHVASDSEPLARLWFDQLLPPPLHGCWIGA